MSTLNLKSYEELDLLRRWALVYYPQLFMYFYSGVLIADRKDFEALRVLQARTAKRFAKKSWEDMSPDGTINCAIARFMDTCECTEEVATELAREVHDIYSSSLEEVLFTTTQPIFTAPKKVIRFIKWHCPLPFVRKGLELKTKWYHKLFWKGSKLCGHLL